MNDNNTLQKIATAINVRTNLQTGHTFPFIRPTGFDNVSIQDKLLLYGPAGIGKSRTMLELIKKDVKNFGNKIYIINPRNSIENKSERTNLISLLERFNEKDVVIWDNFPDDIIKRDIFNVQRILEIISSKNIYKLLVSLKPKYLEVFKELLFRIPSSILTKYPIILSKSKN